MQASATRHSTSAKKNFGALKTPRKQCSKNRAFDIRTSSGKYSRKKQFWPKRSALSSINANLAYKRSLKTSRGSPGTLRGIIREMRLISISTNKLIKVSTRR